MLSYVWLAKNLRENAKEIKERVKVEGKKKVNENKKYI